MLWLRVIRRAVLGKSRLLYVIAAVISIAALALASTQVFADDTAVVTPTVTATPEGSPEVEDYPGPIVTQYPVSTQVVHQGSVTINLSYYGINLNIGPTPTGTTYPSSPAYPAPAQSTLSKIVLVALDSQGTPITHLTHPLTITFDYSQLDLTSYNVNLLRIYWTEDGVHWSPLDTHVDTQNHVVWAVVYHLSTFALAAPHAGTLQPLVFIPAVMHQSGTGW